MLKPGGQTDGDEALEFYAKHTAQIEVKRGSLCVSVRLRPAAPQPRTRCPASGEA